ncbi:hypothetical protein MVES1_003464 [Malassezia vespertilionis]|uniref:Nucleoporin Nup188 N-terminal subdomain III domain-containing protein n=1 Tax=Malassezia vespertilionis TaxID=2020962 RepID=A0A2N1J7A3_9BASI|nr:uncharacterized protein MVES1_003464 [Malassezia vespertilionis]PKI82429.1 hypothetical protein MVES_003705 [Malassezia vespertilionis]WFD08095.1 hypothetical protein MVES1_003464 [Malassezia vespertilionis]
MNEQGEALLRPSPGSFHDLYEHLEHARQTRAPRELRRMLDSRLDSLRNCGDALGKPCEASRAALANDGSVEYGGRTLPVDELQRELALEISARFDIDQLAALLQLRNFLESEHRSVHALQDAREGARDDFLDAFTVFFFEEQLALIRCISALLRISEDEHNDLYDTALATLDAFADAAFAARCLGWFEQEVSTELLPHIVHDERYSLLWARQGVLRQLALLEVVFLLYYGRLQASPSFLARTLETIQTTRFGHKQANIGFLDMESIALVDCVSHLLTFLAIECLNLEAMLEPVDEDALERGGVQADPALALFAPEPSALETCLGALDAANALVLYAPLLLGWSLVLRRLGQTLDVCPDAALYAATTVYDNGPPIWRRLAQGAMDPTMDLFAVLRALLASPLLSSTGDLLGASNLSALAYRAVFKGLLLALTELVEPAYLPDFDALVAIWAATFGPQAASDAPGSADASQGIASLCVQFWTADMPFPTRASVLTTARRRFPAAFLPLVELARALSGNAQGSTALPPAVSDASAAVLDYVAALPTLALPLIHAGAAGLQPWEKVEQHTACVQYRLQCPWQVPATTLVLPQGTQGMLISPLDSTPPIVLWELAQPVSGWRIMRDALAACVAPPPRRTHDQEVWDEAAPLAALSPDLHDAAAPIADAFVAVLASDAALASALLAHLDDAPSLVHAALEMLRGALRSTPLNTRMVCAGYKLLGALLFHAPNEIWQHVRATNLLLGSPGNVPLLDTAHAETSALLEAEVASGRFAGTLALFDLIAKLVHELQVAQFAEPAELLAVKAQVLRRAMHWVLASVWPEHQAWTYAKASDRTELGLRCVRLFSAVLSDAAFAAHHASARAIASLTESVRRAFGEDASASSLAPLLSVLGHGERMIDLLYTKGQVYHARLTETLVETYLHFALLLAHRTAPHRLTTLFFRLAPSPARDLHAPPIELAKAVLRYVWAPMPPPLSALAAQFVAAICRAADVRSTFRLAAHLGSAHDVERTAAHLLGVVENTYEDLALRVAVWHLFSTLLASQPAMATLLLTGRLAWGNVTNAPSNTVLRLAVDSIQMWEELWESAPDLLDAIVQFLHGAWAHALAHPAVFDTIKQDTAVWDALGSLIARDTEPAPRLCAAHDGALHLDVEHASEQVRLYAFRAMAQTRTLHLFAMDLQAPPKDKKGSLRALAHTVRAADFAEVLARTAGAETDAPHDYAAKLQRLVPSIALDALRLAPRRDAFDTSRVYGAAYLYARTDYAAKLQGVLPALAPEDHAALQHDADALLAGLNLAWSLVDAQAARTAAWSACFSTGTGALLADAEARGALGAIQQTFVHAASCLAPRLAADVPFARTHKLALLAALLAAGWAPKTRAAHFASLVPQLASIVARHHSDAQQPLFQLLLTTVAAARREPESCASLAQPLGSMLSHTVASLQQRVATASLDASAVAAAARTETDLEMLVAVVSTAVRLPISHLAWLQPLQTSNTLHTCLQLVCDAPLVGLGGMDTPTSMSHVRFLAPLLRLFATLAAQRAACEMTAESRVMSALCTNALSALLERGALAAVLPSGEPSPLHALWLLMLQIVVALIENLGTTAPGLDARFVDAEVEAFVLLYAAQIRRSLLFAPASHSALDVAQLLELGLVLRLFYAMWHAKSPRMPPGACAPTDRAKALVPLGAELVHAAPHLLQQLAYLCQHPQELRAEMGFAAHHALENGPGARALAAAEDALRSALGTLLALLWDVTGGSTVLLGDVGAWPPLPAVLEPTLHVSVGGKASLGTLLELASAWTDRARTMELHDPARTALCRAMEQSVGLCATQALAWANARRPPDLSAASIALAKQAETEIEAGIGRDIAAAVRAAQGVCGVQNTDTLWPVLYSVAAQQLGAAPAP